MADQALYLRKIEDADLARLDVWLHKPYILKWYEDPKVWLDEIRQRDDRFSFISHFIVMAGSHPIGFCQYYDCSHAGEDWYSVWAHAETYSIDYLIGEEAYLQQGYGKRIVWLLIDAIRAKTTAKEIIVQPEKENAASCNTLESCGFVYDEGKGYYRLLLSFFADKA